MVVQVEVALAVALVLVMLVVPQPSTDLFYLPDISVFDPELPVLKLYVDH